MVIYAQICSVTKAETCNFQPDHFAEGGVDSGEQNV